MSNTRSTSPVTVRYPEGYPERFYNTRIETAPNGDARRFIETTNGDTWRVGSEMLNTQFEERWDQFREGCYQLFQKTSSNALILVCNVFLFFRSAIDRRVVRHFCLPAMTCVSGTTVNLRHHGFWSPARNSHIQRSRTFCFQSAMKPRRENRFYFAVRRVPRDLAIISSLANV